MSKIKIDRLKDVRAGDMVTLRVRDVTITGPAHQYAAASGGLYVYDGEWPVQADVFVSAEREVPALPTEPGFYLDSTGDCWELQSDGQWFPFGGSGSVPQLAIVETYAPFTRLVREGAEAKRIAEWLRQTGWCDEPGTALNDAIVRIERGDWKGGE